MKTRPSRILHLLSQGHFPTVQKINLSDPRVIEIAGLSGVDAVWLCTEHVPNDWISIENQIRAARIHDIDALVRVARGSYSDYIKPLEANATGIIVPHVTTKEEAQQIVEWVRFHPVGKRPIDGGNSDGEYCFMPIDEYVAHSNKERIIILQIECPEAIENLEEIASVPGFNGLMFGPGDFSHRIGKAGKLDAPEVVAARRKVAEAARSNNKFAMTSGMPRPFTELASEGYQVFGIGADVVALSKFIQQRLALVHDHIDSLPADLKPASRSPCA